MKPSIPLSVPHLGGNELAYLRACVESNYVSSVGEFVSSFEREFAAYVGAEHAVACASGTAALHVALLLADAGPGRVVAVSTFTFVASVNAVAYTGATPLLVDSERETWNLDGQRLHDAVTARAARGLPLPSVIELVHIYGHPADIDPLLDLRDRYGIALVEDAAEALGAVYERAPLAGRHVGTIGELGCFSFNGNKILTTGGGGMIVTDDGARAEAARHLTTQAKLPGRAHVHDRIGFNYRMTNIAAAIGRAQLEQLPRFLEARRAITKRYDAALAGHQRLAGPPCAPWASPNHWLYCLLCDTEALRDSLLAALAADAIEARPGWVPAHRQAPYVTSPRLGGDVADEFGRRALSLPSSVALTEDEQDRVIGVILGVVDG
ncbi:MAG: aminotransferase class I/II-fold pyridoxal phosphate-dependent enzyme [Acidimicrobiales bacterium]